MGTSSNRSGPSGDAWSLAKRRATRFISGSSAFSPREVIGPYLSASGNTGPFSGGGGGGSTSSGAGGGLRKSKSAAIGLGGFFADVANLGLSEALRSRGLSHLIGKSPDEVISGLVDTFTGDGAELTDAVVRAAGIETLSALLDPSIEDYATLEDTWNAVDDKQVISILEVFLSNFIFKQWASDMADKLERNAITAADLAEREDEIKAFIKENVRFELGRINPLSVAWNGDEGGRLVASCLETSIDLMGE